jgi:hypothetical protein
MKRLIWFLPLLAIPPILQGLSDSPSQSAPIIIHASDPQVPGSISGAADASSPAIRIAPPSTVEVIDPPMTTTTVPTGLDGLPFAPAGLDACAEMNFYRIQAGLPQRFDDSGRHQRWVRSDGLGWRESKCGNHEVSSTGCCFGYWQLNMKIFLKDWKLGPRLRDICLIVDPREVLGIEPLAKQKQACAAYQLYKLNGLTPWN